MGCGFLFEIAAKSNVRFGLKVGDRGAAVFGLVGSGLAFEGFMDSVCMCVSVQWLFDES